MAEYPAEFSDNSGVIDDYFEKYCRFTHKNLTLDHIMVYYNINMTLSWSGKNGMGGLVLTLNRLLGKTAKKILPDKIQSVLRSLYWKRINKNQSKPRKTLQFEVHITDHCNLNCAGCSHFSPLSKENYLDIETFENDCKRLKELTKGKIEKIHLMGGEPLLHPEIKKIIRMTGKYFGKGVTELVTNGILLSKQDEEFWEECKINKVTIIITKYPIKRNDKKIKMLCERFGTDLEYWGEEIKTFDKIPLDIKGEQEGIKSFRECMTKNLCIQLKEGKLYVCHTAAYIGIFNEYFGQKIMEDENDYIDIYKAKNIKEILKYLSDKIPSCRYCNTAETTKGLEWRVSEKEITEWI